MHAAPEEQRASFDGAAASDVPASPGVTPHDCPGAESVACAHWSVADGQKRPLMSEHSGAFTRAPSHGAPSDVPSGWHVPASSSVAPTHVRLNAHGLHVPQGAPALASGSHVPDWAQTMPVLPQSASVAHVTPASGTVAQTPHVAVAAA
jgi:hypothetical protein